MKKRFVCFILIVLVIQVCFSAFAMDNIEENIIENTVIIENTIDNVIENTIEKDSIIENKIVNKIIETEIVVKEDTKVEESSEIVEVTSFDELKTAIENGKKEITIKNDFEYTNTITLVDNVSVNGNNKVLKRNNSYNGGLFVVNSGVELTIDSITIDGLAPDWYLDYDNKWNTKTDGKGYERVPVKKGTNDLTTAKSLIVNAGTVNIVNSNFKDFYSTASGAIISGAGNNNINKSNFTHIFNSQTGAVLYISGGETVIEDSLFNKNAAGFDNAAKSSGVYITTANIKINNSTFDDNFAQTNAPAVFITNSSFEIKKCTFTNNKCGNDGAAMEIIANTAGLKSLVEDCSFEKNWGMAESSQSMGVIWIDSGTGTTKENPIIFRNCTFKNNKVCAGGAIADKNKSYILIEKSEISENEVNGCGAIYGQSGNYVIKDTVIENNTAKGKCGAMCFTGENNVEMDNVTIRNNTAETSCGAIDFRAANIKISNSVIENNSSGNIGGGIYIHGDVPNYNPKLEIVNTVIKDNKSDTYGGGIYIESFENVSITLTIDDKSKVYDNSSKLGGDDFVFKKDVSNTSENNSVTLDNISIAGITGIDGWYHDNEDDRFADTDNPTQFNDYKEYSGNSIYLKAAGITTLNYDLLGGKNSDIKPITVKYGNDYVVDDDVPKKDGEEFKGWNTKEDGTGVWLKPGDVYDGSEGYILYAHYEKKNVVPDNIGEITNEVEDNKNNNDNNNGQYGNPSESNVSNVNTGDSLIVVVLIVLGISVSVFIITTIKLRKNKTK